MLDVKLYEVFDEEKEALDRAFNGVLTYVCTKETIQESSDQEMPAKVISIRTQSVISPAWANQLEGILTRSQGYDHLIQYKKETGSNVTCGYLPDYCSRAVGEHAILMMMALLRKFKQQTRQFYQFERDGITGLECQGRRVLVVGVGKIGSQIVDIAKALSMEVHGVDCDPKHAGCTHVELKEGLEWAQVVFSAVPLTDITRSMFDYAVLSQVQKGCLFINISRGETSPVEDLSRLLDEGLLGGLSLDVFENEKHVAECLRKPIRPKDTFCESLLALGKKENVILTPHNAFNTLESVERKSQQSVEALVRFLKTKQFPHNVKH